MREHKHEKVKEYKCEGVREHEHKGETECEDDKRGQERGVVKELEDDKCIQAHVERAYDGSDLVHGQVKEHESDKGDWMDVPCPFCRSPWGKRWVCVP